MVQIYVGQFHSQGEPQVAWGFLRQKVGRGLAGGLIVPARNFFKVVESN
jgi:hypothetical protein